MFIAQDGESLVFWPKHQVASLVPTFPQRWRVVFQDGTVAYHPQPLPAGPWVPLNDAWVTPQHLSRHGDHLEDPAGFPFELAELAPVQQDPPPVNQHLPCAADEIWAVEDDLWHTDSGPITWPEAAVAHHPHLVRVRRDLCFNRRRLRRIRVEQRYFHLVYDNGQSHAVITRFRGRVAEALGLTDLTRLQPYTAGLYRHYLREFPFELAMAPAQLLRQHFADADALIVNQIWQALMYARAGIDLDYGKDYRGFFYAPISAGPTARCSATPSGAAIRHCCCKWCWATGSSPSRTWALRTRPKTCASSAAACPE